MFAICKHTRLALLTCVAVVLGAQAGPPNSVNPPNWKGSAQGSTVLDHFYVDGNGDYHRVDNDTFSGRSSHLGQFTATGAHDLNLITFAFSGYATWTAANGDSIDVVYTGQLFPPAGPPVAGPYPFGTHPFTFVATLEIVRGTGRFANAEGHADWSGAFSGDGEFIPVPVTNVFYFSFNGSMDVNGN